MLGIVTRISSSGVGLKESIEGEEDEYEEEEEEEEEEEDDDDDGNDDEEPNVLKDKGVIDEVDEEEVVGIERSMVSIEDDEEERRGV